MANRDHNTESETEYEIEKIIDLNSISHLIKRRGYPDEENTWESLKKPE